MISITACQGDVNTEIDKRYRNIKSYTARTRVTVTGNKGVESYELSQSYKAPDSYRTEVITPDSMNGTVSVILGAEIWLRGAKTQAIKIDKGFLEEQKDYLFLIDFLNDYFAQEKLPILTPGQDGKVMLTAPWRSGSSYRFEQKLWIDEKSNLPELLVTYDDKGNETVRVEYLDFVPNAEIDDSTFLP